MSEPGTGFDGCSCPKGEGCWGQDGWHFYRMTAELYVRQYLINALRRMPPRDRTEERRRVLRQSAEAMAPGYVGLMVAYEVCPHYQQAAKVAAIAKKREAERPAQRLIDADED